MTRKRSNGEGSIYRRKDGKWCAAITAESPCPDDPMIIEKRRIVFYGDTRREALAKLEEAKVKAQAGAPVRDSTATVAQWLERWRLTSLPASDRRPNTKALYDSVCRNHLQPPPFGSVQLGRLRPSDVSALVLLLRKKKLADSTINRIYRILRVALDDGVADGLLARNPAAQMKPPPDPKAEARCLTLAEAQSLVAAAAKSRYYSLLAFIACTGVRKGEALALRWDDVDFMNGLVRIRGTLSRRDGQLVVDEPKTQKSRRTLKLAAGVVDLLAKHKETQEADAARAANLWHETGFVFTTRLGKPVDPRNALRALKQAETGAELTDVTVHTLRHTAATIWLEQGTHMKAVSALLGHADTRVTADTYAHLTDHVAAAAMDGISTALGI
jgi:integrase